QRLDELLVVRDRLAEDLLRTFGGRRERHRVAHPLSLRQELRVRVERVPRVEVTALARRHLASARGAIVTGIADAWNELEARRVLDDSERGDEHVALIFVAGVALHPRRRSEVAKPV